MLDVPELNRHEQICDQYGLTASLPDSVTLEERFAVVFPYLNVSSETSVEVPYLLRALDRVSHRDKQISGEVDVEPIEELFVVKEDST